MCFFFTLDALHAVGDKTGEGGLGRLLFLVIFLPVRQADFVQLVDRTWVV